VAFASSRIASVFNTGRADALMVKSRLMSEKRPIIWSAAFGELTRGMATLSARKLLPMQQAMRRRNSRTWQTQRPCRLCLRRRR
jgi:hypothetical protein